MFREENRFSKSKNRISLFHKNRTSERRFGVLKFSPGSGPDSGGKKRKNDFPLFSGIQWRIFDSFSYIRTQATFIQAEKAGGKSDVLSSRKRKNREFWNRNLLIWKNPVWFIRKGESQTEVSFYLHDTPIVFPLEEHPMYWVNSAESSVFLFSQGRKDEEPWLPSWKCRKKSQQEDSPMYTIWPVCVLLKSPEEERPQAQ